ncbi:MAG: response regulator, partial [Clostridia bacterium]|nr:response regulator [Clostridia bacterium]
IMLSGKDYQVEYVSPNIERIMGVSASDVLDSIKNLGAAKYPNDMEPDFSTLSEVKRGVPLTLIAEREHGRSKEHRFYSETIYNVSTDSGVKYILMISDRTEELLAKQSLEEALSIARIANQSKSTFLANMSHDIRTPMNTIVGLCTLLQRDADNKAKLDEHVRQIMLTSRHMLTLINDIIDMSKIESGETTLNISDINLSDLIKEIETKISPLTKAKRQNFKIIVSAKDERFQGDKVRLKRVLNNLLSNAVKFTPDGGRIDFVIQQISRPSRKFVYLQFVVKDNGVGMSQDFVKKIFQPFARDYSSDAEDSGTGLGMPITKNLVDLMGGTISVESKLNAGSTFTVSFKFPLSKVSDASFWVEQGVTRILYVGGNNIDNNSLTWAMRKTEVTVSFAKNTKTATAAIDKALQEGKGFNMVICDWHGDGEETLKTMGELRSALPQYVPIVMFGDCEWSEVEEKATQAGASAFLAKPFVVAAFKECVLNLKMSIREGLVLTEKSALCGMRFLAAEDNELNSMVLCELLNMVGATCVVKPNGKETVDEFVKSVGGQYDAILMDVQMPVMDGYEATRAIRESAHAAAREIPIIAMTANAFTEDIQRGHDAGMDAYLLKPVDMAKLE